MLSGFELYPRWVPLKYMGASKRGAFVIKNKVQTAFRDGN